MYKFEAFRNINLYALPSKTQCRIYLTQIWILPLAGLVNCRRHTIPDEWRHWELMEKFRSKSDDGPLKNLSVIYFKKKGVISTCSK